MIKKAKELVNDAVRQILKYQSGEDNPIKTRFEHFNNNCLGGIFKGMIITIAGVSGHGKTFTLQQLEEDIFNKKLNPQCEDYVLLRCNWEMSVFKLLLRKLKRSFNTNINNILFNPNINTQEFKKVCDSERSNQIFYLEEPTDAKNWYNIVKEFLITNKNKKHIVVTIDHIALVRDLFGNKKKAMDDLVEYINSLKKEFTNVSFILISQMNRDIESRTDINNLNPKRSDLFNSDTMYQISDLVLVIHNPYKLGYEKYMVIPGLAINDNQEIINDKYIYLKEFMDKPDNKRTNLLTKGVIFWHYLKVREEEDNFKDVIVEKIKM
jgi:replicative DNA helicase